MAETNRLEEARRAAQRAAAARYAARTAQREKVKAIVNAAGPGAADSPARQQQYRARVAGLARGRALRMTNQLPIGLERKIGATLDFVSLAPNEVSRKVGRPVARLVSDIGPGLQPKGFATGFLVADGLLLTNHHVFPTRGDAVGRGANFLFEEDDRGLHTGVVFELDPNRFYIADETLDFAIVAVKTTAIDGTTSLNAMGLITLIEATPKILLGQKVNIIQYPDGGPKKFAYVENRLVDILDAEGFLHYETDTLEGSSGSPAYSENWELVALHHAGIPEMRNGRIIASNGQFWNEDMGDDQVHWIANEGIRVSVIVKKLAGMKAANAAEGAILRDLLASTTDPVVDLNRASAAAPLAIFSESSTGAVVARPIAEAGMANNQFVFNGPVTIHVYAPGMAPPAPMQTAAAAATTGAARTVAEEAVIRFDPNYENREGYDPAFLDPQIRVPLPSVTNDRKDEMLKGSNGKPRVLKYHHYSLAMNEKRRLQMWSAVNVDYDPDRKAKGGRDSFGKDKWILDKRIPAIDQLTDPEFYKPAGQIDRGHIVRREDNAWGDSDSEREFANSDTFHWTNCTPQHEAFNRASPGAKFDFKGLWGDFENHVQQSRKGNDTKACILAGPILADDDPKADFGDGPFAYPVRFWKVVCVVDPDAGGQKALKVYAFILSQKPVVDKFGVEAFGAGRFKRFQVTLSKLTAETGVVFDDALRAADVMRGAPGAPESIRINSLDQVRGAGDAQSQEEAPVA